MGGFKVLTHSLARDRIGMSWARSLLRTDGRTDWNCFVFCVTSVTARSRVNRTVPVWSILDNAREQLKEPKPKAAYVRAPRRSRRRLNGWRIEGGHDRVDWGDWLSVVWKIQVERANRRSGMEWNGTHKTRAEGARERWFEREAERQRKKERTCMWCANKKK